jgi:hypothetical protein
VCNDCATDFGKSSSRSTAARLPPGTKCRGNDSDLVTDRTPRHYSTGWCRNLIRRPPTSSRTPGRIAMNTALSQLKGPVAGLSERSESKGEVAERLKAAMKRYGGENRSNTAMRFSLGQRRYNSARWPRGSGRDPLALSGPAATRLKRQHLRGHCP